MQAKKGMPLEQVWQILYVQKQLILTNVQRWFRVEMVAPHLFEIMKMNYEGDNLDIIR